MLLTAGGKHWWRHGWRVDVSKKGKREGRERAVPFVEGLGWPAAGCSRIGTSSRDCPPTFTTVGDDQARRGGRIYRLVACHVLPSLVSPANPVQSYPIQPSPVPAQLSPAQPKPDGRTCSVFV